METQTKANLTERTTWIRLLYMILFAVFFSVAELVAGVVVVVQFLFKLLTGQVNERLRGFGHNLGVYFQQMVAFLTYHSEEMPYPFSPWPGAAGASAPPDKAATARKSPARRKPKPRAKAAPKSEGATSSDAETGS